MSTQFWCRIWSNILLCNPETKGVQTFAVSRRYMTHVFIFELRVELRPVSPVIMAASKRKAWTSTHVGITPESRSPARCASTRHRTGNCCCDTHANTTSLRTLLYPGRGARHLPKELEPPNNSCYRGCNVKSIM